MRENRIPAEHQVIDVFLVLSSRVAVSVPTLAFRGRALCAAKRLNRLKLFRSHIHRLVPTYLSVASDAQGAKILRAQVSLDAIHVMRVK